MVIKVSITSKSLLYPFNILIGSAICWYGLVLVGISNPIWSIITVILVSDPDLTTAITLARVRVINTIVGCVAALVSLLAFGYSPWSSFLTAAVIVLVVTSVEHYPANWRLTPVTVVIVMDASRKAMTYHDEMFNAIARAGEIAAGCAVALIIAMAQIKLTRLLQHTSILQHGGD